MNKQLQKLIRQVGEPPRAKLTPTKPLKNYAEEQFRLRANSKGWRTCKQGWPDFLCWKGDKVFVVEIKRSTRYKLKREQEYVMNFLSKHGIDCYRWSPDNDSLIPYIPTDLTIIK